MLAILRDGRVVDRDGPLGRRLVIADLLATLRCRFCGQIHSDTPREWRA